MTSQSPEDLIPEVDRGIIIPPRKKPTTDAGYLEALARSVFQAGFSWEVVRDKWPNFQKAFEGFDVDTVAAYGPDDVDRLVNDKTIIRNGRKIEAMIENARVLRRLSQERGSFHAYLRTLDGLPYAKRRDTLARQFKWLGRTGVFVFLWCVDEEVPDWEER